MSDHLTDLKTLHTLLVDARNGYDEAFKEAEGKGLTPLFREMMAFHNHNAEAVAAYVNSARGNTGELVDDSGSIMTTVNRTVMSVRSLFGGLDESILPGLIDGEKRIVTYYDAALNSCEADAAERPVLMAQRDALLQKIASMQILKVTSPASS
jgi:uncharacterized protein (TIGR02284 family)